MPISREQVQHIAKLARVGLSEEDIARFQEQLSEILDYFEALRQVDTEGVPPTTHTLPLQNVMRDDEAQDSFDREDVLANAPQREADYFRVRGRDGHLYVLKHLRGHDRWELTSFTRNGSRGTSVRTRGPRVLH